MIAFVLRRLLLMIPTLWVIATLAFFMMRLAPGGPFVAERDIPPAALAELKRAYGLDRPLPEQYVTFLAHAARLDFGPSYKFPARQVREIILEAFPVSLELGTWALLAAIVIGVPIGVFAALRQNTGGDYAAMGVALLGVSIPSFVLGPALVLGLALTWFVFPPALWQGASSRVLPVLTLSTAYIAYIARLTRGGMLDVLRQDSIRTARAKGLGESIVVWKHALKLGILPVVSYLGPAAARIVTGSIVVESIFAVPGLGRCLVNGAFNRDYTLVMGVVLFYAFFLMVLNLVVDVAYTRLDPRVELS
ncbi:MAG: ABC transporter permease subunit [Candidatus Eisenbacteria bacterium]|uniref:ABC transporter permease subunit n=1 Tax=Eiseniibacteriota bacterium TaxID=2212470 RepID=A0A538U3T7_UNCEI|nr:MAG: ABC transporter permease subunit [Candidatus Eisenbacteria bacterium]